MSRNFCFYVLISLMLTGFSSTAVSQFGDPVPRYPQEMDGPVNMINRALVFSETDIAVPGRGLGIEFTRYYNSDGVTDRRPANVGRKWSHSYQWGITSSWDPRRYLSVWVVTTGSGSRQRFTQYSSGTRTEFRPSVGVRATLELVERDGTKSYIYTTRGGIRYKFEESRNIISGFSSRHLVLTEISDPNGNRLKLHYEKVLEQGGSKTRLVAVGDTQGRILKFYYELQIEGAAYPRYISKIEFGLGTKTALTTVYQTVTYGHVRYSSGWVTTALLTSAAHQLGSADPRGTTLKTQYEYHDRYIGWGVYSISDYLAAVISPMGYRTEFDGHKVTRVRVEDVPPEGSEDGDMLYDRRYSWGYDNPPYKQYLAYNTNKNHNGSRRKIRYNLTGAYITGVYYHYGRGHLYDGRYLSPIFGSLAWSYSNRNVTRASHYDAGNRKNKWVYKIYYEGSDSAHNRQMGNPTKWEQVDPTSYSTALRKWETDYETKFNRPIWQIDPMGHKTTFTYDTKGNLTEQRHKANTGSQPHAVDHDIVTTHAYDAYGNRIKTTFMPKTTQEKVVETVYDSTHHTYPIEVKTTVTVDGKKHTIKTKSEWDVNRGLKTADIDAQGRRTEYAYWKDRKLKYTRRAADNVYTVPTYDKNGNVTQTQVRQTNWQTGTLIAQTKTEYDAMNRAVKAHSFKDNWTTPYATAETTYDIFGDVSQTKDPRGLITNYTRDELGRVTKQTLPDGDWVETRYNSLDQVTKAWTSQNGSETSPAVSHTYDKFNRLSQVSYKSGESVSYTYDLGDNTLTQKTNDGSQTYTYTYTHDQLNRVMTRNDSLLGYKTFYAYDDASMRTRMSIQPSTGNTKVYDVKYAYDEANRLLSVTDASAGKTASYDYFDIGALKTVTYPNGITAHRTLDTLNRLDTLQYKKDATTVLSSLDYTYDVKSNVTQLIRNDTGAGGSSKTFSFGYDNLSRLTSANYGNETVSYTYDKSGNRLTQVSSVDGTTTYTIAANSNQLNSRSLVPEDSDFSTMSYSYDKEGKLTQRSEGNDSDAFSYGFGSQLTQIQKTRDGAPEQTLSYSYDGGGQRVKVTDSGGTRYFLYDGMMPVLELDADKNIAASYLYGADGAVYRRRYDAVAHWAFDEGEGAVAHDVDGQNHGALGGGDTNKAPTWSIEGGGSLFFDGVNDVVKVPDSDALDLAGDELTISCWVRWSATLRRHLVKKSDASNGYRLWISAGGNIHFELLFGGTAKTVSSAATIPINQWKHVCARYDGSELRLFIDGTKEEAATAATGSLAATTEPLWVGHHDGRHFMGFLKDVSVYDRALSDAEIANLANGVDGRYEYHHVNALGSNIVLTDDDKNVLVRYEYDVFGAIRSEVGTSDNVRKFTGKEYESDVKLYYFAARYYDPYIGRFTSRDPIGEGINWYAYAANNPLKFIDPSGLALVWVDGQLYYESWWQRLLRAIGLPQMPSDPGGLPADVPGPIPGIAPGMPVAPGNLVTGEPEVPKFDANKMMVSALVNILFKNVSPGQVQTDRQFKDAIDNKGGYDELGTRGKDRYIREVQGTADHGAGMFKHLAGDRPVTIAPNSPANNPTYKGTDPDGNIITYRAVSRGDTTKAGQTGHPTFEVNEGGRRTKIRFVK